MISDSSCLTEILSVPPTVLLWEDVNSVDTTAGTLSASCFSVCIFFRLLATTFLLLCINFPCEYLMLVIVIFLALTHVFCFFQVE